MSNNDRYDLISVGTGFASSFFLKRFLEKSKKNIRVLVLEKGTNRGHQWYMDHHKHHLANGKNGLFINYTEGYNKSWTFNVGFGGGSYAWHGVTPRFDKNDFKLKSRYNYGVDWPISYDDLEPYYDQAEAIMKIAGPKESYGNRTTIYPLKPHNMNAFDKILKEKFPDRYYSVPSAKPTENIDGRAICCNSGVCRVCPIDAKFTVNNSMMDVYSDPRVEIRFEKHVTSLDIENRKVKAVNYLDRDKREHKAYANLFNLGANPIFNSHILVQSKLDNPLVGKGIVDQRSTICEVDLDGIDNIGGSTNITSIGYMLATDAMRKEHAGAIILSYTIPDNIRLERGKYFHRARFAIQFEDLPQKKNHVTITDDPTVPKVVYLGHSEYTQKGLDELHGNMQKTLEGLPIEKITFDKELFGGGHMYGGTIMGTNKSNSVVDMNLRSHDVDNLYVTGSSTFPSTALANPTLTIAALSLRAADSIFKG
jgi:choline dehydrogenase-like flavoprotein